MINDYLDESQDIWVVTRKPYDQDAAMGFLYSCGYGHVFKKVWKMTGLPSPYITCIEPTIGATYDFKTRMGLFVQKAEQRKPPLITILDQDVLRFLCPITKAFRKGKQGDKESAFAKWAGSLLVSPYLSFPHYIIGSYPPDFVATNFDYHEIQAYIDFGHIKDEYKYWCENNKTLLPLTIRKPLVGPPFDVLMLYLNNLRYRYKAGEFKYVSSDIETLRAKKDSYYHKLGFPGITLTISFAPSSYEGVAYCLWDYTTKEAVQIWRITNAILSEIPQIGQNYYSFDSHLLEALGFQVLLRECQDTMLRHAILWPGLPHKLQFQTKQYTREPYYKDEGKTSSPKYRDTLLGYNCKDTMVTYEIFNEQEKEFDDRPHLR